VTALQRAFGTRREDIVVAIGPSIGPCCYEVGPEVREAFRQGPFGRVSDRWFADRTGSADGRLTLDMWMSNAEQLVEAGVPAGQVHVSALCTASHPEFFPSYRRDGKGTGRIAAVIRSRRR